jgi:hypothetical protein
LTERNDRWGSAAWLACVAGAVAYVVRSLLEPKGSNLFTADGNSEYVGFGWPVSFMRAAVDSEVFSHSYWVDILRAAQHPALLPVGVAIDVGVGVILAFSAGYAAHWILQRLRPQFTLSLALGLLTFAALEVCWRWRRYHEEDAWRLVQYMLFSYSLKLAWFLVFLACLVVPHVLGPWLGRFLQRSAPDRSIQP